MSVRVNEPARKAGSSKPVRPRKPVSRDGTEEPMSVEQRARMQIAARAAERHVAIAREAYCRAEQRGFAPGHELDDWLAAEARVDADGSIEVIGAVDDPVDEREAGLDAAPVRDPG